MPLLALIAALSLASDGRCSAEVEQRLDALAVAFDDQARVTITWAAAWSGLYGTLAIVQGVIATQLRPGNPTRADLTFGAVASAIGSFSLPVLPTVRFLAPIAAMRARWGEGDRCALLADAEALERRIAAEQSSGSGWFGEAGNLLINAGIAIGMGWGLGHWEVGLMSGAIGLVVGELVLRTQPVRLAPVASPAFTGVLLSFAL